MEPVSSKKFLAESSNLNKKQLKTIEILLQHASELSELNKLLRKDCLKFRKESEGVRQDMNKLFERSSNLETHLHSASDKALKESDDLLSFNDNDLMVDVDLENCLDVVRKAASQEKEDVLRLEEEYSQLSKELKQDEDRYLEQKNRNEELRQSNEKLKLESEQCRKEAEDLEILLKERQKSHVEKAAAVDEQKKQIDRFIRMKVSKEERIQREKEKLEASQKEIEAYDANFEAEKSQLNHEFMVLTAELKRFTDINKEINQLIVSNDIAGLEKIFGEDESIEVQNTHSLGSNDSEEDDQINLAEIITENRNLEDKINLLKAELITAKEGAEARRREMDTLNIENDTVIKKMEALEEQIKAENESNEMENKKAAELMEEALNSIQAAQLEDFTKTPAPETLNSTLSELSITSNLSNYSIDSVFSSTSKNTLDDTVIEATFDRGERVAGAVLQPNLENSMDDLTRSSPSKSAVVSEDLNDEDDSMIRSFDGEMDDWT